MSIWAARYSTKRPKFHGRPVSRLTARTGQQVENMSTQVEQIQHIEGIDGHRRSSGHEDSSPFNGSADRRLPQRRLKSAGAVQGIRCELCGQSARVHVLEGYDSGRPILRHFCLPCAARDPAPLATSRPRGPRLRVSSLVALAGIVVGVVGVFGELLVPEGHAGFGWYQRCGVALGAVFMLVGTLMRADLIALTGAFLFGAALCADWLGITRAPGVGWKQQILLGICGVCVFAGLLGRVLARHPKSRADALADTERCSETIPEC
jgi:hypothetical protein